MESIYELVFPDVNFSLNGDTMVKCPFPHTNHDNTLYYEDTPSLSINLEKGVHHCFGCGVKGNELQFLSQYMGIDMASAVELREVLEHSNETEMDWNAVEKTLWRNEEYVALLREKLRFSEAAIKKLRIGLEGPNRGIAYPVFCFGKLVNVISYHMGQVPKYTNRTNSKTGFIMPYDSWRLSTKPTLVCAGQKDLAIALSHDINAITITGGEGDLPKFYYRAFEHRDVYIVYDNDDTGRNGAISVALALKPWVHSLKILDISPICKGKGEDLWDFFVTYGKTKADLEEIIRNTPDFSDELYQIHRAKLYPKITLKMATSQEYLNRTVCSSIQVTATDEEKFLLPYAAHATKVATNEDDDNARMKKGDKRFWNFHPDQAKNMFYMIDGAITEKHVTNALKEMMHIGNEKFVAVTIDAQEPVYKCSVTDFIEAVDLDDTMDEYVAYSIKHKMESGKHYTITYKLVPHPLNGNVLNMVIFEVEEDQDSVTSFKVTPDVVKQLRLFQVHDRKLTDVIYDHVERVKGIVNADYAHVLLELIDLWFHTPLRFNLGAQKNLRACLDTLIVAESRVGKTTTVQALQRMYNLGTRVPLNGKNATVAGIVGGSNKVHGSFQTRAGIIPRSHKGAVILEELAKAKNDLLAELTDIRSSGSVTISRVNGTIMLPAYVRMLTLTNAKVNGATPKPIASYPNGIEIIVDLVGKAEDVARYDIIGVLPSRGAQEIDPFFEPLQPWPEAAYRARIRWVWSRTAEQIVVTKELYQYAVQQANILNRDYDSYIKIFGPETYLKLLRIAIAAAGYTVSTDAAYQLLIVERMHIDYAVELMKALYDNGTFRMREFVAAERTYSETNSDAVKELQQLWEENSTILLQLEMYSTTNQRTLQAACGEDQNTFNAIMSKLISSLFVRIDGYDIAPTERFRKTMKQINRASKERVIRIV